MGKVNIRKLGIRASTLGSPAYQHLLNCLQRKENRRQHKSKALKEYTKSVVRRGRLLEKGQVDLIMIAMVLLCLIIMWMTENLLLAEDMEYIRLMMM